MSDSPMLRKSAACALSSLASALDGFNKAPHMTSRGRCNGTSLFLSWTALIFSVVQRPLLGCVVCDVTHCSDPCQVRTSDWGHGRGYCKVQTCTEGVLVTALLTLSMCELCKHNK